MPTYLSDHAGGVYLSIKVQPRASSNEIGPALGSELKVKVTAPPVDARANEAVLQLLADRLACRRSALQLVRGHSSRHKTIFIEGITAVEAERRLSSEA